ncbi:MAG: hypothetical protein ACMUIU_15100 [bacterium]
MIIEYALIAIRDLPEILYSSVMNYKLPAALVVFGLFFIIFFAFKLINLSFSCPS